MSKFHEQQVIRQVVQEDSELSHEVTILQRVQRAVINKVTDKPDAVFTPQEMADMVTSGHVDSIIGRVTKKLGIFQE